MRQQVPITLGRSQTVGDLWRMVASAANAAKALGNPDDHTGERFLYE